MRKFAFIILVLSMVNIAHSQWTQQNSGTTAQLLSVSAPSDQVVWASGSTSSSYFQVIRTTNGGLHWDSVSTLDPRPGAGMLISGIDENTAVICYDTIAMRTTNGGLSWNILFTQPGGYFNAIEIGPDGKGYIMGDPVNNKWSIWKTTNFGANWTFVNTLNGFSNDYSTFNSLFAKGDRVYFCSIGNKVHHSSNGGNNWVTRTVPFGWPVPVWFYNDSVGLVGGGIAKTTNNGVNWTTLTAPGAGPVRGITGYGNNWWYIKRYGTVHFSSDYGASWHSDSISNGQDFWDIAISHTGTAMWIVGNNGVIYSNNGITNVLPLSSEIPLDFILHQNYPNPFNPATKIKFDIPLDNFTELSVYDLSGKLIRKLINEKLTAGSYEAVFDGQGLSSGIYFYTLKSGNVIITNKMILIK